MIDVYSKNFGKVFVSIDDITFTAGSVVVANQLSLTSQMSDAVFSQTAVVLTNRFAQNNFTLDSVSFALFNPPPTVRK
jgi:hypothetical protein